MVRSGNERSDAEQRVAGGFGLKRADDGARGAVRKRRNGLGVS